jgi:hypothetical protein
MTLPLHQQFSYIQQLVKLNQIMAQVMVILEVVVTRDFLSTLSVQGQGL